VTPTPVDREKINRDILKPEQAKRIVAQRVHQQRKYVVNTEAPKLARSASDGDLSQLGELRG